MRTEVLTMTLEGLSKVGIKLRIDILPWGPGKGTEGVAFPYIARPRESALIPILSLELISCERSLGESRVLRAATA